jgi:hypothetical protein
MKSKIFTVVKVLIASTIGGIGLAILSGIVTITVDVDVKSTPQPEQSASVKL